MQVYRLNPGVEPEEYRLVCPERGRQCVRRAKELCEGQFETLDQRDLTKPIDQGETGVNIALGDYDLPGEITVRCADVAPLRLKRPPPSALTAAPSPATAVTAPAPREAVAAPSASGGVVAPEIAPAASASSAVPPPIASAPSATVAPAPRVTPTATASSTADPPATAPSPSASATSETKPPPTASSGAISSKAGPQTTVQTPPSPPSKR